MRVIVINGPPCVGKSALLKTILRRLPPESVVMDGDDVCRSFPFEAGPRCMNLIQDNMLACAKNFALAGMNLLILAYPFPCEERVRRLTVIFGAQGVDLEWIRLVATDAELQRRWHCRGGTNVNTLHMAFQMVPTISRLNTGALIDTTALSVDELSARVLRTILNGGSQ